MNKKVPIPLPDYPLDETLNNNLLHHIITSVVILLFCVVMCWMVKLALEPKDEV